LSVGLAILSANQLPVDPFDPTIPLPFNSVQTFTDPATGLTITHRQSTNVERPSNIDQQRINALRTGQIFEPFQMFELKQNPLFRYQSLAERKTAVSRGRQTTKRDELKLKAEERRLKFRQ
jgi:hypothetical protein